VARQQQQHVQEGVLDHVAALADRRQLAGQVHEGDQRQEGHQHEGDRLQYRDREIALQDFHFARLSCAPRRDALEEAIEDQRMVAVIHVQAPGEQATTVSATSRCSGHQAMPKRFALLDAGLDHLDRLL
jgi:hypothetical protein